MFNYSNFKKTLREENKMAKLNFRNQRGVASDQGTRAAKEITIKSFQDMQDGKGKFAKRKPMKGR